MKLDDFEVVITKTYQPPSGGCVLKPWGDFDGNGTKEPAAFGRLCVETGLFLSWTAKSAPAAFGRLCVETSTISPSSKP